MFAIIAVVATIIMIVKDCRKFYVYLLMLAGVLLYWFLVYGGMYGFDVPEIVSWLASIIPVVVIFIIMLSRRNKGAE